MPSMKEPNDSLNKMELEIERFEDKKQHFETDARQWPSAK
jgi:hypothetical protein